MLLALEDYSSVPYSLYFYESKFKKANEYYIVLKINFYYLANLKINIYWDYYYRLIFIFLFCPLCFLKNSLKHPSLEKGKAIHSSILAWRIPWTTVGHTESDTTEQLSLTHSLPKHPFPFFSRSDQIFFILLFLFFNFFSGFLFSLF